MKEEATASARHRRRMTPEQLEILNEIFERTYFPSQELRDSLGKRLGMPSRSVQVWFQNKRQAHRSKLGKCKMPMTEAKEEKDLLPRLWKQSPKIERPELSVMDKQLLEKLHNDITNKSLEQFMSGKYQKLKDETVGDQNPLFDFLSSVFDINCHQSSLPSLSAAIESQRCQALFRDLRLYPIRDQAYPGYFNSSNAYELGNRTYIK